MLSTITTARRVRSALIGAAAFAMATAIAPVAPTLASAPPSDPTTIEVAAGLDGWYDPGDHVVVEATVTSDELFDGRIDVVADSHATVSRDVQVAGGTTKTFLIVVPTSLGGSSIDVRLYGGDDLVSKRSVALKIAEAMELVGVLPALVTRVGELPEQVNLATEAGKAQLTELSLDQLALGASALDIFDSIAATSADIRSLQPGQLDALLGWLNRGGRLLLDDNGDLSALPAQWRPATDGWSLAGQGEVRVVDGRASSGQWSAIIEPSGLSTSEGGGFFGFGEQLGSVQQDLAARAGVTLPSMLPLLVPLVIYWAVVSIVLYFVLKAMRRLTLAWVAIPLLAALTAGGVVWYGQQWRSVGKPAATAFVDGHPGGGSATTSVLTFSRDGGTVKVSLPAGWQSDSELTFFFDGGFNGGIAPTVRPGADTTTLQVRLEPGQVTTANVLGPTADTGLVAEAGVQGDKVIGTVTNNSPVTLHQVAVFGPGGAHLVGTLAPGERGEFSIAAQPLPIGFSLADRVWDGTSDPRAAPDEIAELGIWSNATAGRVMYPSGMVRAAGWTTELPLGIDIAGGHTTTAVLTSLAPIQPSGPALPAASVRSSMVRTPFSQFGNGTADTVYRYVVPPDTNLGQRMMLKLPAGLNDIELWNGSGWIDTKANKGVVIVPTTSIVQGVVMARIVNDGEFFPSELAPTLRGVAPGEVVP